MAADWKIGNDTVTPSHDNSAGGSKSTSWTNALKTTILPYETVDTHTPTEMQVLRQAASPEGPQQAIELAAEGAASAPDVDLLHDTSSIPWTVAWRLYLSHFLSTWNSRSFEFGSVLFLAVIYPHTLLYLSIYGMVRSASVIVSSTGIGWAIDRKARLPVVRVSIVSGRLAVIASSLGFWALWSYKSITFQADMAIFTVLIFLSCVEKTASVANLVSVERDWAVVIAAGNEPGLQKLNARMRRIDLFCKLAGPLFIALINGASTTSAIWVTLGLNVVSLPVEYFAIAQVHRMTPRLGDPRSPPAVPQDANERQGWRRRRMQAKKVYYSFRLYFRHLACLPSFALSLLYLTILSFGGQMVTYLLSAGFNSFYIALVRSISVVLEMSATWIAPKVMSYIGPSRGAIWFLSWQILWLLATVSFFWCEPKAIVAASGLAAGTILSRIGLWGYDLCAQIIIQTEVQEEARGSFSSIEAAFQNVFELISYALTIALPRPDQFKYPALVSVVAVGMAGAAYAWFLRERRGHLVHVPCLKT